jgi:hypothetical protein
MYSALERSSKSSLLNFRPGRKFQAMQSPIATDRDSRCRSWLVALLLVGLLVRLIAVPASSGIVHPDEHQQYMEQSFRLVHGYGAMFWEQRYGMRHALLPDLLAVFLWIGEMLGLTNPHALAAVERLIIALASYGAMACLAWSLYIRGRKVAAVAFAFLLACSVDLVFIQARVMSENACIGVLALVLTCWPGRPFIAGCLLGAMMGFRLQTAPLAAGFWSLACWLDLRRAGPHSRRGGTTARLTAGLIIALLVLGWMDYRCYGDWFHSFTASVVRNWVEGGASQFGSQPAYNYLVYGSLMMLRLSIVALYFLFLGARLRLDLAAIAGLFIAAHSLIPHKEARFLWPLVPIGCLLLSFGFEALYERGSYRNTVALAAIMASFGLPSAVRACLFDWRTQPYMASCQALAWIGKQPDVRGVLLVDIPRWLSGNYFFLRNDVPIAFCFGLSDDDLASEPNWQRKELNYVVMPKNRVAPQLVQGLERVHSSGRWAIFRRASISSETFSLHDASAEMAGMALCQPSDPTASGKK